MTRTRQDSGVGRSAGTDPYGEMHQMAAQAVGAPYLDQLGQPLGGVPASCILSPS